MADYFEINLPGQPRSLKGLAEQLAAAGLGVVDLAVSGAVLRLTRELDWTPVARQNARDVVQAYTPPPRRRRRPHADLVADLLSATAAERNRLLANLLALVAAERPGTLASWGSAIADDEADPVSGEEPTPKPKKRQRKAK